VIHHESIGKMDFLVGAKTVRGEEFVVEPVERVGLAIMIETHDVLVIDVIGGAGFDPLRHSLNPYSSALFICHWRTRLQPLARSRGGWGLSYDGGVSLPFAVLKMMPQCRKQVYPSYVSLLRISIPFSNGFQNVD
jgi:hypothetical protein